MKMYVVVVSKSLMPNKHQRYHQLMSVTKDIAGATAKAEAEAKIKDIADKQRIEAENYEETLRIQREEGQYAQHMPPVLQTSAHTKSRSRQRLGWLVHRLSVRWEHTELAM